MRNRAFWTYDADTVEEIIDKVLGEKRRRAFYCSSCGTFHAEGLDSRFRDHHVGQEMKKVSASDVADYRQLEHKEGRGDE